MSVRSNQRRRSLSTLPALLIRSPFCFTSNWYEPRFIETLQIHREISRTVQVRCYLCWLGCISQIQDVLIALADLFRDHLKVSSLEVVLVFCTFIGNLKRRKPTIE